MTKRNEMMKAKAEARYIVAMWAAYERGDYVAERLYAAAADMAAEGRFAKALLLSRQAERIEEAAAENVRRMAA